MINSDFYLILLLISLAAAPLVHLIIAYYIDYVTPEEVLSESAFANLLPSVIEENAETVDKKLKIKG